MRISAIVDLSSLDYPKVPSSVVFFSDCNMKCGYCQNYDHMQERMQELTAEQIFNGMDRMFSEAIVISGGEPTLQLDGVKELLIIARENNLKTKLDTNGTNPEAVKELLNENLLDYVAMDVKCGFDNYLKFTNYKNENIENKSEEEFKPINDKFKEKMKQNILKIIKYCKDAGVFIECRTTYIPQEISNTDIEEIAKIVKDADLYAIQQYDNEHACSEEYKEMKPATDDELLNVGKLAKKYHNNVVVRGLAGEIVDLE
ncbi:anaerobic ribonucleoside-triphosphate reductase activating protein [Methanococcus voltae]|uniref:Anaerobic ribonucleoside-triphosphate reductase activating protein n=1 Tax=Methanococcus voltae (strain ATCC BAA-1334 / A3) TaxID=456320 RepID=D7DRE2_METV3|nr:anaerobic ribonucleoside-triphosphate reductase activating protein [Methanococcus voltae]MCS3901079.1 pyruvate formate lyase activating enzyme [Methanococcus voltae]